MSSSTFPSAGNMSVLPEIEHPQHNCRKAYQLCFVCGSGDHLKGDCPFKKTKNAATVRPAHPLPPSRKNPHFIPTSKHITKHKEDQVLEQMAEGCKHIIRPKRKPEYQMRWEQKAMPDIWDRNPDGVTRNHYPHFVMLWVGRFLYHIHFITPLSSI